MIERKKWDYLADIRARTGARTLYISSTPRGIYQWDLGAIKAPQWLKQRLPSKTDFAGSAQILKEVGYLDIQHADLLLV